jgi:hypothetical protein
MRVIGPNCMGVINTDPVFAANASFSATPPPVGSVAMVSQSGALGEAILADATSAGLGVAMFASVGNRVDVTAADLVAYWGDDPQVKVILLYLETVGEPQEFVQVARAVARKKPIIAVKSGRSDAGALAASSHTGSIAGADVAADTLLAQCGVLRVDSFRDMFALAQALLNQPPPAGRNMLVVTGHPRHRRDRRARPGDGCVEAGDDARVAACVAARGQRAQPGRSDRFGGCGALPLGVAGGDEGSRNRRARGVVRVADHDRRCGRGAGDRR